jgi:hypothetical protein
MEGTKGEGGLRYPLRATVHKHYDNQEWSRHRDRRALRMEWWTSSDKETQLFSEAIRRFDS